MNRKGELASAETGDWTLRIIGFIVVLVFVGGLFLLLKGSSEDDLCKLSILSRATSPIESVQEAIPIKCTTKKLCFGQGNEKCNQQFAGEKKINFVKLPKINGINDKENIKKASRIIEKESAEKMYECWKLMGEGKLDLFNGVKEQIGFKKKGTSCVICSRLAIDSSINDEIVKELGMEIDINEYMRTAPIVQGSKLTYLQAFLNSKDVQGYSKVEEGIFGNSKSIEDNYNKEVYDGQIDEAKEEIDRKLLEEDKKKFEEIRKKFIESENKDGKPNREIAFVFMQIKSVSAKEVLGTMAGVGGTFAGSVFMTPVVKNIATRIVFTPIGGIITGGALALTAGYGVWNAKQGQLTAANYCGEFTSNEKSKEGCSMVQGLNYNEKEINSLCDNIEGRLYDVS